jgi:hypothetical protein
MKTCTACQQKYPSNFLTWVFLLIQNPRIHRQHQPHHLRGEPALSSEKLDRFLGQIVNFPGTLGLEGQQVARNGIDPTFARKPRKQAMPALGTGDAQGVDPVPLEGLQMLQRCPDNMLWAANEIIPIR